jgi:succinate dehydrogenase/fumarate reductase cytochrome b subunit
MPWPAPRWPARLDLLQSGTGLALGLFMWVHMFFVASILLGPDAMWTVARFFEGYHLVGRPLPWLVSILVAVIFTLFVAHAALALRKFPASYRQYRTYREHMKGMRHEDTTLWYWQVVTGFALFFMASVHLYIMLTRPDRIGPAGEVGLMQVHPTTVRHFRCRDMDAPRGQVDCGARVLRDAADRCGSWRQALHVYASRSRTCRAASRRIEWIGRDRMNIARRLHNGSQL